MVASMVNASSDAAERVSGMEGWAKISPIDICRSDAAERWGGGSLSTSCAIERRRARSDLERVSGTPATASRTSDELVRGMPPLLPTCRGRGDTTLRALFCLLFGGFRGRGWSSVQASAFGTVWRSLRKS